MKRIVILSLLFVLIVSGAVAQGFEKHFTDSTLRIDYIFAGSSSKPFIALDNVMRWKGWAGRRSNLSSVPLDGNGDFTMRDAGTGEVLYRTGFSTLYQEWLNTAEAQTGACPAFEFTILAPEPRGEVYAEIVLRDKEQKDIISFRHVVSPLRDALIRDLTGKEAVPYEYIHRGGSAEHCIDVAIVAEGYTPEEMHLFLDDARATADVIMSYAPFSKYRNRFNFIAVKSPSADSNVSVPQDSVWRSTALNSHFMTFGIPRYLTTKSVHRLNDILANIPYEHIIILANTDVYGGSGIYNSYTLTTAHHHDFKPVVVHEFGHSFAGLADEYGANFDETYSLEYEPWEANITTMVDFSSKWGDMLSPAVEFPAEPTEERAAAYTVGLYEGAGYREKGIYRPAVTCRMRDNSATRFCPVCERAIERIILHQIGE